MIESFLSGAISMGFLMISLFFLKFWRNTLDRLFLFFSLAFILLLLERIVRASFHVETEWIPAVYLFRLAAYGLLILGVIDKNRRP